MHDIVLVEYFEGVEQLLENEKTFFFSELSFFADESLEGASIAEFVNEVEVIGGFEHVVVLDDVVVVLDVSEDVYFVDRTFLKFFVFPKFRYGDHFDRVFFLVIVIGRPVDFAVDAGSNFLVEGVVLDVLDHVS
jgi:hypothetical protein